MNTKMISIPEFYELWQSKPSNTLFLDVRRDEEYQEGHVPGSKNISHDILENHLSELEGVENVVIYCRSGGRVRMATEILSQKKPSGMKSITLVQNGGMPDWTSAGYPVEK